MSFKVQKWFTYISVYPPLERMGEQERTVPISRSLLVLHYILSLRLPLVVRVYVVLLNANVLKPILRSSTSSLHFQSLNWTFKSVFSICNEPFTPENVFKCRFVDDVILALEPMRFVLANVTRVMTRICRATMIYHSVEGIPANTSNTVSNLLQRHNIQLYCDIATLHWTVLCLNRKVFGWNEQCSE